MTGVTLAVALGLACSSDGPAELPPSRLPVQTTRAYMVKAAEVEGYLARPVAEGSYPGVLVLVDTIDDGSRALAEEAAAEGRIVLAVAEGTDPRASLAYLDGLPATTTTTTRCERRECP